MTESVSLVVLGRHRFLLDFNEFYSVGWVYFTKFYG